MPNEVKFTVSGDASSFERTMHKLQQMASSLQAQLRSVDVSTPGGTAEATALGRRLAGVSTAQTQLAASSSTSPGGRGTQAPLSVDVARALASGGETLRGGIASAWDPKTTKFVPSLVRSAAASAGLDSGTADILVNALSGVSKRPEGGIPSAAGMPAFSSFVRAAVADVQDANDGRGYGQSMNNGQWRSIRESASTGGFDPNERGSFNSSDLYQAPPGSGGGGGGRGGGGRGGKRGGRGGGGSGGGSGSDDDDTMSMSAVFGSYKGFLPPGMAYGLGRAGMAFAHVYAMQQTEQARSILTGHPDYMAQAGATGGVIGAIAGGAIGYLAGGPIGAGFGAGIGSTAVSAIFEKSAAEKTAATNTAVMMIPTGGLVAGLHGSYGATSEPGFIKPPFSFGGNKTVSSYPPAMTEAGKIRSWAYRLSRQQHINILGPGSKGWSYADLSNTDPFGASQQEIASGYGNIFSGMFEGGIDPTMLTGGIVYGEAPPTMPGAPMSQKQFNDWALPRGMGSTVGDMVGGLSKKASAYIAWATGYGQGKAPAIDFDNLAKQTGISANDIAVLKNFAAYGKGVKDFETNFKDYKKNNLGADVNEEFAKWVTGNISSRYGTKVDEITKMIAPVFGSLPETGGNLADILLKFGAGTTYRYLEGLTPFGEKPQIVAGDLMHSSAQIRGDERRAKLGSLGFRGVGKTVGSALEDQMRDIAAVPGGEDSEAYGVARQKRKGAMVQEFDEEDATGYEMTMTRYEGMRSRAKLLPYSPGVGYAYALRGIGMRSTRLRTLESRRDRLRKEGTLSERDELSFAQQEESLQTANAQDVAMLSEGMEDRMPVMSAGTPGGFRKFDSMSLAAYHLAMMASPMRRFGAVSGRQAREQDEFVSAFVGHPNRPHSPNMMDSAESLAALKEIAGLLRQAVYGRGSYERNNGMAGDLNSQGRSPNSGNNFRGN